MNCKNGIRSDKTDQIHNLARLNQTRNNTAENALTVRKNIQGSARNENWVPHRPDQNFCTITAIYTLGPNSGNDVTHHQYNAVENRFIYTLTNTCSVNTDISASTVTTLRNLHPGQRKIPQTRGNIQHPTQNKLPPDTLPGKNRVGNDTRTQGSLRVHKIPSVYSHKNEYNLRIQQQAIRGANIRAYTYTNTLRQKVRATETYTEHIPPLGWTTLPQGAKVQHRPAKSKPHKTHQGDTPKHHTSDVHHTKSLLETNHTE